MEKVYITEDPVKKWERKSNNGRRAYRKRRGENQQVIFPG